MKKELNNIRISKMSNYQSVDPKFQNLLKERGNNKSTGNFTNATMAISTPPIVLSDKSKTQKEATSNLFFQKFLNFDKAKRSFSEYSITVREKHYQKRRRSNSSHDTLSNKLIINPKILNKKTSAAYNFLMNIFKKPQTVCCQKHWYSNLADILLRALAVILFIKLETSNAFKRKIHMEELWLYQNPMMPDIITPTELLIAVILIPWLTSILFYYISKNKMDYIASIWVWTLALCINGLITSMFKISFGRPRPDFFYRCFPDGIMILNNATDLNGVDDILNCTGDARIINEGRKSFPSGHSSFAFTSSSFITLYAGTKLHAFDARGRGQNWRLVLSVLPLAVAALVAISRTCDYHHHWQDVLVGAVIGVVSTYMSYRQYYPSIFNISSDVPLTRFLQSHCEDRKNSHGRLIETKLSNENARPIFMKKSNYKK